MTDITVVTLIMSSFHLCALIQFLIYGNPLFAIPCLRVFLWKQQPTMHVDHLASEWTGAQKRRRKKHMHWRILICKSLSWYYAWTCLCYFPPNHIHRCLIKNNTMEQYENFWFQLLTLTWELFHYNSRQLTVYPSKRKPMGGLTMLTDRKKVCSISSKDIQQMWALSNTSKIKIVSSHIYWNSTASNGIICVMRK